MIIMNDNLSLSLSFKAQSVPCNGACPDDMMLCDVGHGSPEPNFMCFAEVEILLILLESLFILGRV